MKKRDEEIRAAAKAIEAELKAAGYRVKVDDRPLRPGAKYYHWEMRGVPLRVEIGPRDIDNGVVMAANRFGVKEQIPRDMLISGVSTAMDTFTGTLRERAEEHTKNHITLAQDLGTAAKAVEDGAAVVHWCGSKECADRIEEELDVSILGTHIRSKFIAEDESPCPICGKPGKPTLVGRSY